MSYRRQFAVRFGDIDEAGVVYYPRLFDYFHQAFEDFWAVALERPYPLVVKEERVGYPTVHIETDFKGPLRYGDQFEIEVSVQRIGTRSISWSYRGFREGAKDSFLEACVTTACVDMDTFVSKDIPADHKKRFSAR